MTLALSLAVFGCHERREQSDAVGSLNNLPEVQKVRNGDFSMLCESPFSHRGDAGKTECAESIRRGQLIVAACRHLVARQGFSREHNEYTQRMDTCVMEQHPLDAGLSL